jgi:signal transduction histidine kinase
MINTIKKASDDLLREGTVDKAYGEILSITNQDWFSVGDLTQAVLTKLDDQLSMVAGIAYLLEENGLVPLSAIGCTLPAAAGETVKRAMERNEIVRQQTVRGDSMPCILTEEGMIVPGEIIVVPLTAQNCVVAMLELVSRQSFSETDLRIISRIASPLGIGINSVRNGLALRAHSRQLETANIELRIQQEATTESNRLLEKALQTKSDFLANMSHELRTPLNAVIGFSQVLQDQLCGPINPKQQEYVINILTSGNKLLSMINDMIDLSRMESGSMLLELSTFSLRETLDASLLILGEKARENSIELRIDLVPEVDISIIADQKKLKQIMFNLLSNAVKFSSKGGVVNVSAASYDDLIEISVTDTGIGIKEDQIPSLFQIFTQLESVYTREYQGSGLGLALTRQLVEFHGGRIWVKSLLGAGSRFSFTIPLKLI